MVTDTSSNTYRGQDVIIESVRKETMTSNPDVMPSDPKYTKVWNKACVKLADAAKDEELPSTAKAYRQLIVWPDNVQT